MNRKFINGLFILMLIALIIMATTGLMFLLHINNHLAEEIHKITGLTFITLIIIHIIVFRKMAYNFLFGPHAK